MLRVLRMSVIIKEVNLPEAGGPIVVEELTDEQLAHYVEDVRRNVKRLSLETRMFEGFSPSETILKMPQSCKQYFLRKIMLGLFF